MVTIQEWIDNEYPKDTTDPKKMRERVGFLTISDARIEEGTKEEVEEGSLILEGFTNLFRFSHFGNKITQLDLSKCTNLGSLWLVVVIWNH